MYAYDRFLIFLIICNFSTSYFHSYLYVFATKVSTHCFNLRFFGLAMNLMMIFAKKNLSCKINLNNSIWVQKVSERIYLHILPNMLFISYHFIHSFGGIFLHTEVKKRQWLRETITKMKNAVYRTRWIVVPLRCLQVTPMFLITSRYGGAVILDENVEIFRPTLSKPRIRIWHMIIGCLYVDRFNQLNYYHIATNSKYSQCWTKVEEGPEKERNFHLFSFKKCLLLCRHAFLDNNHNSLQ